MLSVVTGSYTLWLHTFSFVVFCKMKSDYARMCVKLHNSENGVFGMVGVEWVDDFLRILHLRKRLPLNSPRPLVQKEFKFMCGCCVHNGWDTCILGVNLILPCLWQPCGWYTTLGCSDRNSKWPDTGTVVMIMLSVITDLYTLWLHTFCFVFLCCC